MGIATLSIAAAAAPLPTLGMVILLPIAALPIALLAYWALRGRGLAGERRLLLASLAMPSFAQAQEDPPDNPQPAIRPLPASLSNRTE